ncbi:hypothetical protein ACJJWD_08145 [Comamonas testosteroni]|uniref:hypothetical protein n=1 Tax=Comamonas testosteroni TaxID=285 RepID=UPI00389AB8FE
MATLSSAHAAVQSNAPTTGSNTPDPIQLHTHALNSLSRCKAMLTAREPMYLLALQWLAEAQRAIATLQSIDLSTEG